MVTKAITHNTAHCITNIVVRTYICHKVHKICCLKYMSLPKYIITNVNIISYVHISTKIKDDREKGIIMTTVNN